MADSVVGTAVAAAVVTVDTAVGRADIMAAAIPVDTAVATAGPAVGVVIQW